MVAIEIKRFTCDILNFNTSITMFKVDSAITLASLVKPRDFV